MIKNQDDVILPKALFANSKHNQRIENWKESYLPTTDAMLFSLEDYRIIIVVGVILSYLQNLDLIPDLISYYDFIIKSYYYIIWAGPITV